ncbi:MAG TPA: MATE family efflux transporter [Phaeodactylibacter sp.]|nr:MATE family efflux transporter [Phaeodactylibacter sp.]
MNKEILRLAIPNIISNVSIPLLSTVDTMLMGRLSELHIGAVGVGAMIFNLVYWNFGFLRMGTTGITAQAFGKKDDNAIFQTLSRALLVAMTLAVVIVLLHVPFAWMSFYLMNISEVQYSLVEQYFYIRIWAAPATLGLFAMMGWFFGMQNAVFPLIITIFVNVVNIILSYIFVKIYGWDVAGVAWGTVIAQYAGILLSFFLFYKKYKKYLLHFSQKAMLEIEALKQYLTINRDIFIRTLCLTFAFAFFYSQSSKEGATILAANVILLQFLNWMSYGVDGFAFASESLVGKYHGAKDVPRLKKAIRLSFIWGMVLAIGFSLAYWIFGVKLLHFFTNQEDVIAASLPFLFWMILFPVVSTPCYIWDGIYIGLTASKAMRDAMILALGVYFLVYFLLKNEYGNDGLWAALLIFMAARGLIQWGLYRRRMVDGGRLTANGLDNTQYY